MRLVLLSSSLLTGINAVFHALLKKPNTAKGESCESLMKLAVEQISKHDIVLPQQLAIEVNKVLA